MIRQEIFNLLSIRNFYVISLYKRLHYILFWISLFFWAHISLSAQNFPVQATSQIIPPYPSNFSAFTSPGQGGLRLILVLQDLRQGSITVGLAVEVARDGRTLFKTSPGAKLPPIELSAGVPQLLAKEGLSPYFQSPQLEFTGAYSREAYGQNQALPEGFYTITFRAFDFYRPDVGLSLPASATFFLGQNAPPLLNLPQCGETLPLQNPQQVLFSWTPRHTLPRPVEYGFSLYEIRPPGRDPNDVVLSSRPIYQSLGPSPQLIYDALAPPLIEGTGYAWQVRVSAQGAHFTNQGRSEVCHFVYGGTGQDNSLGRVRNFQAQALTESRAQVLWEAAPEVFDGYRVYFKRQGEAWTWHSRTLKGGAVAQMDLLPLVPGLVYELKMQGIKGQVAGPYTDLALVEMPSARVLGCRPPDVGKSLATPAPPLGQLGPNQIVKAQDLELTISQAQSQGRPGWYGPGKGFVRIPFLGNANFAVSFQSIYISEDFQVTAGELHLLSQGLSYGGIG